VKLPRASITPSELGLIINESDPQSVAVTDHLTSFGGQLKKAGQGGQMSILRWLEAGATGSFGTVVEPCNFVQKFPDTRFFLPYYFRGNTLVEAYWKSVAWPGEGLFIGDPLARPWGTRVIFKQDQGRLFIRTTTLQPYTRYVLQGQNPKTLQWEAAAPEILIKKYLLHEIVVSPVKYMSYKLAAVGS